MANTGVILLSPGPRVLDKLSELLPVSGQLGGPGERPPGGAGHGGHEGGQERGPALPCPQRAVIKLLVTLGLGTMKKSCHRRTYNLA